MGDTLPTTIQREAIAPILNGTVDNIPSEVINIQYQMANFFSHKLPRQYVYLNQLEDNLQILLNDIFMIRVIDCLEPIALTSIVYNTDFTVGFDGVASTVVKNFARDLKNIIESSKETLYAVVLGFYYNEEKTRLFGWQKYNEKVYWERWTIEYRIIGPTAKLPRHFTDLTTTRKYIIECSTEILDKALYLLDKPIEFTIKYTQSDANGWFQIKHIDDLNIIFKN